MSILNEIFAAETLSVSDLRNPALWLDQWMQGRVASSGEAVGADSSMGLGAYYAALRAISEDTAKLPLQLWRRLTRGRELEKVLPVADLYTQDPNPDMGSMSFRETVTQHALSWGNGYAWLGRSGRGRVREMIIIHPSRVELRFDHKKRVRYYQVTQDLESGLPDVVRVELNNMLHIHGLGGDGITGYSVFRNAADSIGLGLALQSFGGEFFANGTVMSGVLEHPETLSEEAQTRLKNSWRSELTGKGNRWQLKVLEEGLAFKPTSIPPEEALMIESMNFTVEEMARWFRIPPHKLQHLQRATFSNIEQLNLQYWADTICPWAKRWEEESDRKLLTASERKILFFKHDPELLIRGDNKSRSLFNKEMFAVGAFSSNDIRDREGENPTEDGDTYYVPSNMTRAEDGAKGIVASGSGGAGDQGGDGDGEGAGDRAEGGEEAMAIEVLHPIFLDVANRVMRKEMNATLRASKRYDGQFPADWLDSFYGKHADFIVEAFLPASISLAKVTGRYESDDEVSGRIRGPALASVEVSRQALAQYSAQASPDAALELWSQERPKALATRIMQGVTI